MGLLWEKLLINNGIVRSTTELYCMLCESDTSFTTCAKHVESRTHVQHLQWFRLIFETCGNNIKCKICDTVIAWGKMKLHSKLHIIIPWSEPVENYDKYKIFFENQIFQWNNIFHCCPCNIAFPTWESALIHITDRKHQRFKEKAPLVDDFLTTVAVSYESLVTEGLIAFSATMLRCRICDCKSVTLSNVDRHIKGLMHLSYKSRFQLKLREREASDSVVTAITEEVALTKDVNVEDISEQLKLRECEDSDSVVTAINEELAFTKDVNIKDISEQDRSTLNYILKHNNSNSYCVICDCEISNNATSNHVMEIAHIIALKRYGCDAISLKKNADYYCRYCDCMICSLHNVYLHIKGRKHQNSIKLTEVQNVKTVDKVLATKEPTVLPELPGRRNFPCNYLVRLNEMEMQCKACDCKISARAMNQEIHVTGKKHKKSLKIYGCERISFEDDNIYHCGYCDIVIYNVENVYVHMKEASHINSLTLADKRKSETTLENGDEVEVSREASKALGLVCPSVSCNYVTKKTTGSYCEICDIELSNEHLQVERHVTGSEHANALKKYGCNNISLIGDRYFCVCCECNILGCKNIYKHVKGRKHLLHSGTVTGKLELEDIRRRLNELKIMEPSLELTSALHSITAEISGLLKQLSNRTEAEGTEIPDFACLYR